MVGLEMKLEYLLPLHFVLGIGIGWLDRATSIGRVKRSEWIINQPVIVQYLLALVLQLVIVVVVYERIFVFRSLLYAALQALTMLFGFLAVRYVARARDNLKAAQVPSAIAPPQPVASPEVTEATTATAPRATAEGEQTPEAEEAEQVEQPEVAEAKEGQEAERQRRIEERLKDY